MMSSSFFISLFWAIFLSGGQTETGRVTSLSETISSDARPHFDKGLLLLHNFEYVDAAEEFITAQQKDPGFALSYWGEAMTYDHPIWRDLDVEKSRAALKKLGATPEARLAKGKTELEKDIIKGVEILFGEGSKPDREKAYAGYMGSMYSKYSGNNDVAAFYALSLLGTKSSLNEWEEQNVKAAEIAEEILKNDPDHPGALHYLVHADDHPRYARNGLAAADRYGKVASYAGHALHMPSHIYVALGMWDESVASNEISWKASVARKEKKHLDNDELSYHTHLWLMYGYLQQGRFGKAKEVLDTQVKLTHELPSLEARIHLMGMQSHYLLHTDGWNSPAADMQIKSDDFEAGAQYSFQFIEGYRLFRRNQPDELATHIAELEKILARDSQLMKASKDIVVCGTRAYSNIIPTEQSIAQGNRRLNQLKGLHAWLRKDMKAADGFFRSSLSKESLVVNGPPFMGIVAHELYADFLLADNRPAEAFQQFDKALAKSPNRYTALKGKVLAARMLKDHGAEAEALNQLKKNLKNSDPGAHLGLW